MQVVTDSHRGRRCLCINLHLEILVRGFLLFLKIQVFTSSPKIFFEKKSVILVGS